jgi:hypothetical protein
MGQSMRIWDGACWARRARSWRHSDHRTLAGLGSCRTGDTRMHLLHEACTLSAEMGRVRMLWLRHGMMARRQARMLRDALRGSKGLCHHHR